MISAGIVNGIGSALLWNAQGTLIIGYAERGVDGGKTFAIFWAYFNVSGMVGGLVSFGFFYFGLGDGDVASSGVVKLYAIFLSFLLLGVGVASLILIDPQFLVRDDIEDGATPVNIPHDSVGFDQTKYSKNTQFLVCDDIEDEATPVNIPHDSVGFDQTKYSKNTQFLVCDDIEDEATPVNIPHDSVGFDQIKCSKNMLLKSRWYDDSIGTIKLFVTRRTLLLLPIFFFTGYKQAYQIVTFGDRFFNTSTLGIEILIFYAADVYGGIIAGNLLDGEYRKQIDSERKNLHNIVAKQCILLFVVVNVVGNICAVIQEWPCIHGDEASSCITKISIAEWRVILPSIAYASWGFTDGAAQTYCYWVMGIFYGDSTSEESRVIGFFTCVQSAGWCLGFLFVPLSRMKAQWQLAMTFVSFIVGILFALVELPGQESETIVREGGFLIERPTIRTSSNNTQPELQHLLYQKSSASTGSNFF